MTLQPHPSHHSLAYRKARRQGDHPDPYLEVQKPAGILACTQCHVVHSAHGWHWGEVPPGAVPTLCPACRRVRDRYAAHVLRIEGVPHEVRGELLNVLFKVAEVERNEHPLERLMLVREDGDAIEAATTGMHIARRLSANLLRRWRRCLHVQHGTEHTKMSWRRGA